MKLTIIGAGKMGEALTRGWLRAGLVTADDLTLCDVATAHLQRVAAALGARAAAGNAEAARGADLVVLAVKPKDVPAVCTEIGPALGAETAVLSIAAGVPLAKIATALGCEPALARTMPNTPCLVGAGAFGLSFNDRAGAAVRQMVRDLLTPLGVVEEVPEALLDAVTGLSGSGTAYVALFIEALADGGVLAGLPRATALRLAAQTVYGAAKMILETGEHPAAVKDAVASPGGTTIAAIAALEAGGFRAAAINAVRVATERSKELGK
jgi:pyrroline-5-carboxylate reductase